MTSELEKLSERLFLPFIFLQDVAVHWRCSDRSKLVHWMLLCLMVELLQEDHRLGQTFSLPHPDCHSIIYYWYDLVRVYSSAVKNLGSVSEIGDYHSSEIVCKEPHWYIETTLHSIN